MSSWKEKVHPELARRVETLQANLAKQGLEVRVVQSLRTAEEQNNLYAQGRSKSGKRVTNAKAWQSNHNYGLATDVCPFKDGKPDWDDLAAFRQIGAEAKRLGLEWGGDWKAVDMPHVQLKGLSVKECYELYQQGGLPKVWARMYEILGGAKPKSYIPSNDDLIEFGDRGEAVKTLQQQLVKLNLIRPHEVDGIYGKISKNAVIGFQRQNNLTADGIVGPGTKAKLQAALETLSAAEKSQSTQPPNEIESEQPPKSFKLPNVSGAIQKAQEVNSTIQQGANVFNQARQSLNQLKELLPGALPTDTAIKVTSGKKTSFLLQLLALLVAAASAVWGFLKENSQLIIIGVICVVVVAVAIGAIFSYINGLKMKIAADPTKYNVE